MPIEQNRSPSPAVAENSGDTRIVPERELGSMVFQFHDDRIKIDAGSRAVEPERRRSFDSQFPAIAGKLSRRTKVERAATGNHHLGTTLLVVLGAIQAEIYSRSRRNGDGAV